ncbi:hypothetical protein E4U01_09895 [Streptococcus acidominimus]|uniref:Uncharacterized protein n=1 Tax=Streptococcus acidominimus TaxID=1326 RepID=A0A4Y9FJV7_STRAI|nr:hypothetical protein [Streptococcus acidominimus]TFU29485.1 hypothetical protein E4U01_09895 [Streptococcus acidominimus]
MKFLEVPINKRLELFLSSLSQIRKQASKSSTDGSSGCEINEINSLTIETASRKQKYLPKRKLTVALRNEGKSDTYKIYYGTCKLYLYAFMPKDKIVMYYLKVLDNNTDAVICDLAISPLVYGYISEKIATKIPSGYFKKKEEYLEYATSHKVAFVSKMNVETNGNFKNVKGILADSRMLFID